ncbi:MAG: hypothetical protein JST75_14985 [Bacteroidetes bacterium]|nr:hypothetical protein [Bacteroidota bacterium]
MMADCAFAQQKESSVPAKKKSVVVTDTVREVVISIIPNAMVNKDLKPVIGDSYEMLQQAIDFYINTGIKIKLAAGNYYISRPLVIARVANGKYAHVALDIEGAINSKNAADGTTNIITTFTEGFGIGIQLGKSVHISNLAIQGKYVQPRSFSQISVDTLDFADWDDRVCGQNPTSPYAGIVVDFASDPAFYKNTNYKMYPGLEKWYLSGMSRSGSTQVFVEGVSIKNFIVGFIVTPSNQQNGEIIHLYHSQIGPTKVAYALCQAQSKQCEVKDLEIWETTHTVFDNVTYGFHHGDGAASPMVDGVNCAGAVHQLFNISNYSFPANFTNVFAESIFKLGQIGGTAGAHLNDFVVDFPNASAGFPSPDFYLRGDFILHTGCMYRLYGSPEHARIILIGEKNTFVGGCSNEPPLCINTVGSNSNPVFMNMSKYYGGGSLNRNDYDSLKLINRNLAVYINRKNFSGYLLTQDKTISKGDLMVTRKQFSDQFSHITGLAYPLGFVSSISGDTVFLQNMGVGIHNGEHLMVWNSKLK